MKQKIELRKVPCGEIFTVFGDEFVVLDHIDGGVLSIRKDIWKKAPFDKNGKNDLRAASINDELSEYVRLLGSRGAVDEDINEIVVDLKATDGTRSYGYRTGVRAGLLTLEQYGLYKDIIPLVDDCWWLATPWSTPLLRSPDTNSSTRAWYVYSDGNAYNGNCSNTYGVRPVLNFNSQLLVSVGEDNEVCKEKEKKAKWNAYLEYLHDWTTENGYEEGNYGSSPITFDEWNREDGEQGMQQKWYETKDAREFFSRIITGCNSDNICVIGDDGDIAECINDNKTFPGRHIKFRTRRNPGYKHPEQYIRRERYWEETT